MRCGQVQVDLRKRRVSWMRKVQVAAPNKQDCDEEAGGQLVAGRGGQRSVSRILYEPVFFRDKTEDRARQKTVDKRPDSCSVLARTRPGEVMRERDNGWRREEERDAPMLSMLLQYSKGQGQGERRSRSKD